MDNVIPNSDQFLGRFQNGVVVFDESISLREGQTVSVSPVKSDPTVSSRVEQLKLLFEQWDREDALNDDNTNNLLSDALMSHGRMNFRESDLNR